MSEDKLVNLRSRRRFNSSFKSESLALGWTLFSVIKLVIISVMIAGGIFLIGYEMWGPPYLSYPQQPLRVLKDVLHPGETVPIVTVRCSTKSVPANYTTSRELVNVENNVIVNLQSTTNTVDPGCTELRSATAQIPEDIQIPSGSYYIRGNVEIAGLVATKIVSWRTEVFKIDSPIATSALPPDESTVDPLPPIERPILREDKRNLIERIFNVTK